jgi:glycosyltransferase involved in cell wall biosynthesis
MINVSIIIPTYNRSKILIKTLKALENQSYPKSNYEVVIVDDGSTDDTNLQVKIFQFKSDLKIRYFRLNHISACHARNIAIINAKYDLILSIDDDIIATPNFIDEHVQYHKDYNLKKDIVVLGYITWPPECKVSSFMSYIIEKGPLYGYALIKDEFDVPFSYLYGANFSIDKTVLLENGMLDEKLPNFFRDTELGYQLKKRGFKIILNKKAVAYHCHPITISSFMKRQKLVGFYAVLFYLKYPELKDFLVPSNKNDHFWRDLVFKKLLRFKRISILDIQDKFYYDLLRCAYNNGFKNGLDKFKKQISRYG